MEILKQYKPILWLGGIRDIMTRTQSYYGLLNMPMMLIILYTVRMQSFIKYIPWLTLPVFIGILALLLVIIAILDYKIIYPSQIAYHQHEAYKHRSLIRQQLDDEREENKKRFERLEHKIDIIMEHYNGT